MGKADFVEAEDGRLAASLAARLEPSLQDALDHPVRREVLRTLNHGEHDWSVAEIGAQLPFRLSQLTYHLQVLRRSGTVVSKPAGISATRGRTHYASVVAGDGHVRSVLRATERWDRERREAAARRSASPLLTMFRVPRPVQAVRLRGREEADGGRSSE